MLNLHLSSEFNMSPKKMLIVRDSGFFYVLEAKWEPGSASDCPPFFFFYLYNVVHILNLINPTKQLSMDFEWYPED